MGEQEVIPAPAGVVVRAREQLLRLIEVTSIGKRDQDASACRRAVTRRVGSHRLAL